MRYLKENDELSMELTALENGSVSSDLSVDSIKSKDRMRKSCFNTVSMELRANEFNADRGVEGMS